jgi:hypothetical protein
MKTRTLLVLAALCAIAILGASAVFFVMLGAS